MWTRREIKQYAKDFLKRHYAKAFIVCLIATLLGGGGNTGTSNNNYNDNNNRNNYNNEQDVFYGVDVKAPRENGNPIIKFVSNRARSPLSILSFAALPVVIIIFTVLIVTIGFAIEVGKSRFFLDGFRGDVRVGKLFSTFNGNEYLPIVKTQFLRSLYIILWSLLLIIPGIIKAYQYRFIPYILAEEPNLPSKQAMQRSKDITHGHKMDMFILDLSFIGWEIVGLLLFGIGIFFVYPYEEATYARLYNVLSGDDDLYDYEYDDYDMMVK